jgi:two-component system LytT family response regulator
MASDKPRTLRAYLVDDEPLALRNLLRMLEQFEGVEVLGQSTNPEQALVFLSQHEIDLLFLDIRMPGLDGFDLLSRVRNRPAVIFTTAYDAYALDAFRADAIDYLVKPIRPEDLAQALEKAGRWIRSAASSVADPQAIAQAIARQLIQARTPSYPTRITSRVGGRIQVIDLGQVTHFAADGNLTYAVTLEKRHVVDISLSDLELKLNPSSFVRIHRATLVNLSWIEEVHGWFGGRLLIRLKRGGEELKVARDRARTLKDRLGL